MTSFETTFVDAIRKKYEKLTEYCIFETFTQRSPNRHGANIIFPARTLTMDGQHISRIGNTEELAKAAGHVAELDLSGNKLRCWIEVFTLLRCLDNLECLNLSQNPLGTAVSACMHSGLESDTCTFDHEEQLPSTDHNPDHFDGSNESTAMSVDYGSGESASQRNSSDDSSKSEEYDTGGQSRLLFADNISREMNQNQLPSPILDGGGGTRQRPGNLVGLGIAGDCVLNDSDDGDSKMWKDDAVSSRATAFMNRNRTRWKSSPNAPTLDTEQARWSADHMFPRLTVLALNATNISWYHILKLVSYFPNLKTLHTAMNNHGCDQDRLDGSGDYSFETRATMPVFPRLHTLYFSNNGVSSWWTVCRLGRHFPSLEQLVLLGNPLDHIPFPLPTRSATMATVGARPAPTPLQLSSRDCGLPSSAQPFTCLQDLGLSETLISRWESVDALVQWMPKLINLRLGNDLPVFQSWPESTCRAHVIARLPVLVTYNRSVIDPEERDMAEREFVRHYGQVDPNQRPARYWELERQHGRLEPLANIDLSPKRFVCIRAILGNQERWHELNLNLKISQVKRQLCNLFGVDQSEMKRFRLLYFNQILSAIQGPEEMRFTNRALHSYKPESGDLFELIRRPDRPS